MFFRQDHSGSWVLFHVKAQHPLMSACMTVFVCCERGAREDMFKRRRGGWGVCVTVCLKDREGGQGVCLPSRFRDPVGEQ